MACPFFMPTRRSLAGVWLHPSRLPLGAGWEGNCTAPGHEGTIPDALRLQEHCNLGYATECPCLPKQRDSDSIRFAVARGHETRFYLTYVCEKDHLPGEHGELEFSVLTGQWTRSHADLRIQKMAECFLDAWRARSQPIPESEPSAESAHERT